MPFDGFTIRALCQELNNSTQNARINKIHMPEKDEIIFNLRQFESGSNKLLISSNPRWARMHISSEKKTNPTQAPLFCMVLRKHLEGGKIKEIYQVGFERIVHIRIEALNEFREWKEKILVCEFMGRHSNILIVDPEKNLIIDAMKKFNNASNSVREILPGKEYCSPPSQDKLNPLSAKYEDYAQILLKPEANVFLSKAIFQTFSGISPWTAYNLCVNYDINPDFPVEQCGEYELSLVYKMLQENLVNISKENISPCVVQVNNTPLEYSFFNISVLNNEETLKTFPTMNETCDYYYMQKLELLRLESVKINLIRKIKDILDKISKKSFNLEGDMVKALKNNTYKIHGELLTAYAHDFQKGDIFAEVENFYSGEKLLIELDPRLKPIENAQKYFKIYNKSQKAIKHLEHFIEECNQEIDYLESVIVLVQQCESLKNIEEIVLELEKETYLKNNNLKNNKISQNEKSKPRKYISSDGLEILVGRNNRQNDILTLKTAEKTDLWLHTKDIPGTHAIIKLNAKIKNIDDLPNTTLIEAASLSAYFSKAGQSEKVPVDYTFRSNVKKPMGAKPGMVIYDNYWTIMVNPQSDMLQRLLNLEVKDDD